MKFLHVLLGLLGNNRISNYTSSRSNESVPALFYLFMEKHVSRGGVNSQHYFFCRIWTDLIKAKNANVDMISTVVKRLYACYILSTLQMVI